jgi:hypothetical protein
LANAQTGRGEFDPDLPAIVVESLARHVGFEGPVIDLTDCLRRSTELGGSPYWGTNTHWSVEGNRMVGEVLSEALAPLWVDASAPSDSTTLLGCSTSVAPAAPEVERQIAEAVPVIRDLLRFEQTTQALLLGRDFEDRAAVSEALERAGYTADGAQLAGALEGFVSKRGDRISRPHDLRRFVRPRGWALDRSRPGEPLFVVLLHAGRVVGIARTREAADAERAKRADVAVGTPNVGFHTVMQRFASSSESARELWVVALSPAGTFAWLQ